MNKKIAGFVFLGMTLMDVALIVIIRFVRDFDIGLIGRLLVSEAIMIIPCMAGWLYSHDSLSEACGIRKIKLKLVPACAVLTALLTPVVALVNLATLTFTENEAGQIFESLSALPFWVIALFSSVVAPLVEELTFRGILFGGIRKSGSALQAIFLSALAFGLFHMNINQAAYAFLLGLFFGILREISGSVWPSVICHLCVNGSSTIMMGLAGDGAVAEAEAAITGDMMLMAAGGLMIVALITTTLAVALIMWIAEVSGKENGLAAIFSDHKKEKSRVISIPYLMGCAICIGSIVAELILSR